MGICWMLMFLLGCRMVNVARPQRTCPCKVELKAICITGRDEVHVPCPNVTADEMTFNLYKDHETFANVTCSPGNGTLKCTSMPTGVGIKMYDDKKQKSASFILTGLTNSSNGTYYCEATVIYPPPMKTVPGALGIHVLIEGNICKCNKSSCFCCKRGDDPRLDWVWIAVIVLLSIYSIIVTIIAVVNWIKLRNTDSHSDYMNTKPRAPRERRNKKGIPRPIPRHF